MQKLALVALPLASLILVACGSLELRTTAEEACARPARDYAGKVAGAFTTTIEDIRRLAPLVQPARWPNLAPDHPAYLCYIDGEIPKAPPPPHNGPMPRSYDRAVIVVVDGRSELIMAGYRDRLPVRAP